MKKTGKKFGGSEKTLYLCIRKSEIGVWCNGNTADSGPAFPGSSPGTPTEISRTEVTSPWDVTFSF